MAGTGWTTLVQAQTLARHLGVGGEAARDGPRDVVVLDVRHDLKDPDAGPRAYASGHLPGALHAHVDRDLSAPVQPHTGRHPLPDPDAFAATCSRWGIGDDVQVVAYDDMGGAWAARAWWLLREYGHERVALLDGGLAAWRRADLPLTKQPGSRPAARFAGTPGHMPQVNAQDILQGRGGLLLDARASERYRGEAEPIDPVAGHIPHAVSAPFSENLAEDGTFLPAGELRTRYERVLGGADPRGVAVYCGSGVTAPHLLLAMEVAGLRGGALYPGSWSEWIRDPSRPVRRADPERAAPVQTPP